MEPKSILDKLSIPLDIAPEIGKLALSWEKELDSFSVYRFLNSDHKETQIKDNADYLKLFTWIAEKIYAESRSRQKQFILACTSGGTNLMVREFTQEEQQTLKYPFVALNKAVKAIPEENQPDSISFYCQTSVVDGSDSRFEKEAPKVAKILKDKNREDWMEIVDNRKNFIKTDMYVLALPKLHSWGFQALESDGSVASEASLVRPVRPIPRGAIRPKRSRKN